METTRIDTKLIFRQARVRNTRTEIKELKAYFSDFEKHDFPGRVKTSEYYTKKERLKFYELNLRELQRDLAKYQIKVKMRRKVKK